MLMPLVSVPVLPSLAQTATKPPLPSGATEVSACNDVVYVFTWNSPPMGSPGAAYTTVASSITARKLPKQIIETSPAGVSSASPERTLPRGRQDRQRKSQHLLHACCTTPREITTPRGR